MDMAQFFTAMEVFTSRFSPMYIDLHPIELLLTFDL